jgi:hypothetical protein
MEIKKGFISKAFPGKQSCEIDYFTAAESTATAAESTTTAAAAAIESAVLIESAFACAAASSAFLPPPQATIATAKPHTITDAINFFIVYWLLKFAQR